MAKVVEEVKKAMLKLLKSNEESWEDHIKSVVKYSKLLAKKLNADEEILEISAWMHDIEKIGVKGEGSGHHIKGAKKAREILGKLGYPKGKISQVEHCILTHSSDLNYPPKSKEAKVLASADGLSHFDIFLTLAYLRFTKYGDSLEECKEWLIKKYNNSYNKLLPEAKKLADKKYDAIKTILGVN